MSHMARMCGTLAKVSKVNSGSSIRSALARASMAERLPHLVSRTFCADKSEPANRPFKRVRVHRQSQRWRGGRHANRRSSRSHSLTPCTVPPAGSA